MGNGSDVIGIGSPRASLESNFALRTLVGPDRFYAGVPESELALLRLMLEILRSGPARTPSLHELELSDAVLILGEDVTNVAPRMALSLRQSVRQQPIKAAVGLHIPLWLDHGVREVIQDQRGPLFIAAPGDTRLDDIATECYRGAPDDLARLGYAIAHALDPAAPSVESLAGDQQTFAQKVAVALKAAKHPLIVVGASLHNEDLVRAAANVSRALPGCALSFLVPECNSFGLALMTAAPLEEAFRMNARTAIILENDLYRRLPASAVDAFLEAREHVVVLDHMENRTTAKAELLLAAATFAGADGTLISNEGRAQRFFRVFPPDDMVRASWQWLGGWQSLDEVIAGLANAIPELSGIIQAAPSAAFRMADARIPRETHRYSGRTAVLANISVHEPKPPADFDSPLSFSMEGNPDQPPAALIPFFWSPGWNSIQAVNKYQSEIAGPLRGGPAGARLIEPAQNGRTFFSSIPPAFQARNDEWLVVPLFHIFGSEEFSRFAPAVAEVCPLLTSD